MGKPPAPSKGTNSSTTETVTQRSLEEVIDSQIGDLISQKQREVVVARMTSFIQSEHFSGPIAHPRHLRAYEDVSPGAADRIISMAEHQQSHIISMDKSVLSAEVSDRKLGMVLGAIAFLSLVGCALTTALLTTNPVVPGLFLGAAAIGGVGLFIKGRQAGG